MPQQKPIAIVGAALMLGGCAATYSPPIALAQSKVERIDRPKADIFQAAERALAAGGYQITHADQGAGVISTAPRDLRLQPETADCGTTMGLDYLLDNRTSTRVAYSIIIYDGRIEVKSNVQGDYRPGAVSQDITLTCVSRGQLEAAMLQKVKSELP
jgi:hypothetical protein